MFNSSLNNNVTLWGVMPDYSAGVNKSVGVTYTAEVNGYLLFNTIGITSVNNLTINDNISINLTTQRDYAQGVAIIIPISAGDSYLLSGQKNLFVFYPCKGVN